MARPSSKRHFPQSHENPRPYFSSPPLPRSIRSNTPKASLSDYQIRDLNDEINKLMREKHMWEVQLRNLGGPNYMRFGPKMYDEDGREVPGSRGYKYFGRAKELPGVKEL